MAEIAYLVRPTSGTPAFLDEAATTFEGRPGVTVVDTASSLEAVFADLRARAALGEVFQVVDLVCEDSGSVALPFPVSEARRSLDAGRITAATLQGALRNAGAPGYPAVLGSPTVTEDTSVWIHGPDVGRDAAFVARLGQLFGPSLTIYAPLVPEVVGGDLNRYRRTVLSGERAPSVHVLDVVAEPTPVEEPMSQTFGKHRGTVVDNQDPAGEGRLKVTVPAVGGDAGMWAAACLPPIPAGLVQRPGTGSTVWVEFEGGDTDAPVWTGVTYGTTFDPDADLTLESEGKLTIRAGQDVVVAAGTAFDVTAGTEVEVRAASGVTVESGTKLDVRSAGELTLQASTLRGDIAAAVYSGVVTVDTLIAQGGGVVSPSYTPGAGNLY